MPTIAQQIEAIRARARKKKFVSFRKFLKEQFGRMPVKGDVIIFPDTYGYSISEVGGPYKVIGLEWDYNTPALEVRCPTSSNTFYTIRDEQAFRDGANATSMFAKNWLKRARFARPDEINFSAFEWKVDQEVRIRFDHKKKKWIMGVCQQETVPTAKAAHSLTRKWAKEWKSSGNQFGEISGFTNLYDENGNCDKRWGHIKYFRVRKANNKF